MGYILDGFKAFGAKNAIISATGKYTYAQLLNEIERISSTVIADEIQRGEVVSILSDYSFNSIALLLALYENKNIIVPITATVEREIVDRINESFTDKVIRIKDSNYYVESVQTPDKHTMINELQAFDHSGLILFSSGSTGKPKAMIHDFDILVDHYKGKKEKSMNMIVFLMFDHIGGLNTLLNALSMGAVSIIPENRNVEDVCQLIQEYKISVLPSSPTFLNLLLISKAYERYDLSSLGMITYGTEVMQDSLLTQLKNTFPKTKFLQTFGTSETGIAKTKSKSDNSTLMKIDDPDHEYKIVDNVLWLKSKTQVMGYLNSSMDCFTDDGWFKTGDLVEIGDNGYLRIIGRNSEIINVGGEKVLPAEIESIILSMVEIEDVMVYGEDNMIMGQIVVADIVVKKGIEAKTVKSLVRKYCKDKIDRYKLPTKVNIVDKTNFGDRFKKIRRN